MLHQGNFINNYYIDPNYIFKNDLMKVFFVSKGLPGKTCLIYRLTDNRFIGNCMATIGTDYKLLQFEYNNCKYKIRLWDTSGQERFYNMTLFLKHLKQLVIYVIDLTDSEGIDTEHFEKIKSNISKETLIYIVGNKLDLIEEGNDEYKNNCSIYREKAKILIENKEIFNYFEVSAKSGKGIDNLLRNIKWYILRDAKRHPKQQNYYNELGNLNKYINI